MAEVLLVYEHELLTHCGLAIVYNCLGKQSVSIIHTRYKTSPKPKNDRKEALKANVEGFVNV